MLAPIEGIALAALPGIRHGFFNRVGGVSRGVFQGLNAGLTSNDNASDIAENRRLVAAHMGLAPLNLVSPLQVHGIKVVTLRGADQLGSNPEADAMVTAERGVAVGVVTADCAPILFADPHAGVIGAAHAGWKGALDGILPATVRAMGELGADPSRITAIIGPTISQQRYEVSDEFRARFVASDPAFATFFAPGSRPGHHQFDLPGFIAERLGQLGIASVVDLRLCTYDDEDWFYSFRRSTHRRESEYGRQISAIALT